MTQIASEDYDNLLIYLHADTETGGFDPALMQQEHRQRRRLETQGDERKYDIMVTFSGNEAKGGGKFTPSLTILRSGVRIVPYDSGASTSYNLDILNEIVNIDDAVSDRDVFDRSSVDADVNIDPTYSPVEIREVSSGSGLSTEQATWLEEIHRRFDLDASSPNTYADDGSSITNSDFTLTKSDNGNGTFDIDRT